MKPKATTVDPAEIREVVEFIDARDALEALKQTYPDVFETLEKLVERYNTALEQADKVCRQRQVSCGPFDLAHFTTKYNAEALYNAVGRDQFLAVGGKIETQTVYDIDKGRLEAAIAQRKLSEEVAGQVRTMTPAYHKPPKLVVP